MVILNLTFLELPKLLKEEKEEKSGAVEDSSGSQETTENTKNTETYTQPLRIGVKEFGGSSGSLGSKEVCLGSQKKLNLEREDDN